jgi:signal transduction histidine kinase
VTAELEALVALRREMGDRVTLEPAGADGDILASPLALRRAFNNLIDNGLRYGGEVSISRQSEEGETVIAFADRGPGVREEMIDRLAEPFLRVEPSRGRATGGAGLGLAIVEALVTAQGGRVAFANRPEGGFLVTLRFPRA